MGRQAIARIVDPDSLDAASGPRARLRIEVPGDWLARRRQVDLSVPRLLTCARCGGGGCDACDRSGAVRLPAAAVQRPLRLQLPAEADGAIVRLVKPLPGSVLDQLLLEVRPGEKPSEGVRMVEIGHAAEVGGDARRGTLMAILLLAMVAAMVAAMLWAR